MKSTHHATRIRRIGSDEQAERLPTSTRLADSARRGFLSIELVMTLPILFVVLLALFEFSLLFAARSDVVEASRAGCRKACLPGASRQDVESEVRRVLNPQLRKGVEVAVQRGERPGDLVAVAVRTPMTNASPDLLWVVGFRLKERSLISETRMVRE